MNISQIDLNSMKHRATFLFVLLVLSYPLTAQDKPQSANKPSIEQLMGENIRKLKSGMLLVRLQTKENSVSALRKAGQEAQAAQVEKKQAAYNLEIIAAFRSSFKFCPVYFFSSSYSELVRAGNLAEVVFVNDSLLPDPSIKPDRSGFLTAEFGILEPDTAAYFQGHYYYYGEQGREERSAYAGGADQRLPVLRIMDERFVQLTDPFPYYVRTYQEQPDEKKINKAVVKMNARLAQFYDRNQ